MTLARGVHLFVANTRDDVFTVHHHVRSFFGPAIDVGRVGAIAAVDEILPTRAEFVHSYDRVIAIVTVEGVRI